MVQHLLNLGANIDQLDKNKKSAYCHVLIKRHLSSDNPKLQEKLTEVANVLGNNGANKNASKYLMFLQGR